MAHDPEDPSTPGTGFTRRGFIATLGTGAVASGIAVTEQAEAAPGATLPPGAEMVPVVLQVNGRTHRLLVEPRWSLLFVLRERLGLTATKLGCERGECGVCTVLVDGAAVNACLYLAVVAEGRAITTIEGLAPAGALHPLQEAFMELGAVQCGYCIPGMILSAKAYLDECKHPTEAQIREALSGNLCRCTGYQKIVDAVLRASERLAGNAVQELPVQGLR